MAVRLRWGCRRLRFSVSLASLGEGLIVRGFKSILLTATLTASAVTSAAVPPAPMAPPQAQIVTPCPADRTVTVTHGLGACIIDAGERGFVVMFDRTNFSHVIGAPLDHDLLFTLLASTDMEQLWPQLTAFTGTDGSRLRGMLRARAKALLDRGWTEPRNSNQLENFVGGSVLATMQAADLLIEAGDGVESIALLRSKRNAVEKAGLNKRQAKFNWVALAMREAKHLQLLDDSPAAARVYQAIIDNKSIDFDYTINGAINYAAMLAELGRGKEALAMIDQTEAMFIKANSGESVPGSDRQFAWIRACALHALGDQAGADKAIAVIDSAPQVLRDASGAIAPTTGIELRLAFCMKNEQRLEALLSTPDYLVDPAAGTLQSGIIWFPRDRSATTARLYQRYAKAGRLQRMREMPAALVPAMNRWLTK